MNSMIRTKLSLMMFLEFFIWGAWFVTMGRYLPEALQFSDPQVATAYGTQALGAIIAPFIIGLIADRYFSAQRILGFLHLIGAILLFMAANASSFGSFYPLILVYMIIYMPTLALVNSVSFHQISDPAAHFGNIRIFGTIGWIVAGLFISYATNWENEGLLKNTFYLAAIASAALGILSFFLPNTPPAQDRNKKSTLGDILGFEALKLLKDNRYRLFFITSILICIPLAFYYQMANKFLSESGIAKPTGIMTFGQVSEALCLLLLPLFFNRFGFKKTLLLGIAAWGLRYVLFAFGNTGAGMWMLLLGIILHGICYDFFFVSGQIYTEFKAGPKVKSAAQGLITLATYGVGMMIGFYVAGLVGKMYTLPEGGHYWKMIWLLPAGFALVVLLFFALTFKSEKVATS